jgi:hypothetical protein
MVVKTALESDQGPFRMTPEQPLTCGFTVGLTGFEPATP